MIYERNKLIPCYKRLKKFCLIYTSPTKIAIAHTSVKITGQKIKRKGIQKYFGSMKE
ncbi:hypothetical protein NUACC21_00400 [Scytonema sp. NUACC21]